MAECPTCKAPADNPDVCVCSNPFHLEGEWRNGVRVGPRMRTHCDGCDRPDLCDIIKRGTGPCGENAGIAPAAVKIINSRASVVDVTPGWLDANCPECGAGNSIAVASALPWLCGACGRSLIAPLAGRPSGTGSAT